jgi:hypothetical protein
MKRFIVHLLIACAATVGFSPVASAHKSGYAIYGDRGSSWVDHWGDGTSIIYYCDTLVDGRRVRGHAQMDWGDVYVPSYFAPSGGCTNEIMWYIHINNVHGVRACVEGLGCTGWQWNNH